MQRLPTTTFKIVFAMKKIKYDFKKIFLKISRKKSKNAEFHDDIKSVKKVVIK
jgi:hypothetical protein